MEIKIPDKTKRALDALARHGLFGSSPEKVARRLLEEKLREIILQGWMGVPGYPSGDTQPLIKNR